MHFEKVMITYKKYVQFEKYRALVASMFFVNSSPEESQPALQKILLLLMWNVFLFFGKGLN